MSVWHQSWVVLEVKRFAVELTHKFFRVTQMKVHSRIPSTKIMQ
jgi:hypothetical protein